MNLVHPVMILDSTHLDPRCGHQQESDDLNPLLEVLAVVEWNFSLQPGTINMFPWQKQGFLHPGMSAAC